MGQCIPEKRILIDIKKIPSDSRVTFSTDVKKALGVGIDDYISFVLESGRLYIEKSKI